MGEMCVHMVTAGFVFVLLTFYAKVASTEPCAGLPCYSYGTCYDTKDGNCVCKYALHKGPNCSDIDECKYSHKDKCGHRGICNNTEGGFQCICYTGWTGVLCENKTGNNASCMDGYYGDNCEKTISCEHGYKKRIENNTERCVCDPGWNQTNYYSPCIMDIDECNSNNPCSNGGTCINTNGSYNCACVQPWSDDNCSTEDTTTTFSTSIMTNTAMSETTAMQRNISKSETKVTERSTSTSETAIDSTSISSTTVIHTKTSMVQNVLFTSDRIGEVNPQRSKDTGAGLAAGLSVGGVVIIAALVVLLVLKFKYKYTASDILFCKLHRNEIADTQMKKSATAAAPRDVEDAPVNEHAQVNTIQ